MTVLIKHLAVETLWGAAMLHPVPGGLWGPLLAAFAALRPGNGLWLILWTFITAKSSNAS